MNQLNSLEECSTSLASKHLPTAGLLALAMTGFISILTETLPAGLLPQISSGLGISESLAGQTVTFYALGSLLAAIPLTVATRGWQRKTVLLIGIIGFLIFNTITALSTNYLLILFSRFMAGVAAGLCWSLLAGYARRMVQPHQQGRALAIAMVGTPIALSLGVPFGTWLGNFAGWRITFGIMSILTLILIFWVLAKIPNYPGQSNKQRLSLYRVFTTTGVRPVLAVIVVWMLAHNILYTYIAPFVATAGLAEKVDLVLLVFGVTALIGIWIVGLVVDRWLRVSVLWSLIAFALTSLILGLAGTFPVVIFISIGVWGVTFGGAATLLQTALADNAGEGADVAQSMCVTVWNLAIAGGGLVGGILLQTHGAGAFPWALLILILIGIFIVMISYQHGFKPGRRAIGASESIGH